MATTTNVPKPKNQGNHAAAHVKPADVQKKQPASGAPGKSTIIYGYHAEGHGGSGKTTNSVKKG